MSATAALFGRVRQTSCRLLVTSARQSQSASLLRSNNKTINNRLVLRAFSAEPVMEEKPIIPGIGKGKTSTGIVGLAVEPDWYNVMLKKFQLLLDTMEDSDMPETCQYRMDVTKWANFVIETVKANPDDPEAVEDEVRMGQVEELIDMADDEMICMKVYIKKKIWAEIDPMGPEVDFNPDPMKDDMGLTSDPRFRERVLRDEERAKAEWDDDSLEEYEVDPEDL